MRLPTLVSARFDFGWFVLPGLLAAAVGVAIGLDGAPPSQRQTGLGLWIVGVLLVDVAHVWASLYRTYLDPQARALHARALWLAPLAVFVLGVALHLQGPLMFWSALAYVAIFHFIKQHVGFALLYVRAGKESLTDRRLVEALVWASTAGPVVWWHANLPTRFSWFMQGDLLGGVPQVVGFAALLVQLPLWVAYAWRRWQRARGGHLNPMLTLLIVMPAINWHLGIVVFNDDRVFTITNVFAHGVPYLALTWVAGGRAWVSERLGPTLRQSTVLLIAMYYGALVVLAFTEELLWDRWVWHDHAILFGDAQPWRAMSSPWMAIVVALLTIPQGTHYVLDRFIWRPGARNPRLAAQLGLS